MNALRMRILVLLALVVFTWSCSDGGNSTIKSSGLPDRGKEADSRNHDDDFPEGSRFLLEPPETEAVSANMEKVPDVIFVPTPNDVVEMMLHLARIKKGELIYDLGCGDGRIVVAAAKKHGCKAVGFDIDPDRVRESKAAVKTNRLEKLVTIEKKDIFKLDLSKAGVVFLYLLPELNVQLIPQLDKLKPGCRIISHDFDMEGVLPDSMLLMTSKEDKTIHRIYLWTTPLKKTKQYNLLSLEEEEDNAEEENEEMDDGGVNEILDQLEKDAGTKTAN